MTLADEVEQAVTDGYVELSKSYGLNPTIARVYMAVFFAEEPISLKEIAEKTGYSKSTAYNTLEYVERLFDVKRVKKPGSKRVYFKCEHSLLMGLKATVDSKIKDLGAVILLLEESERKLSKDPSSKAKTYGEYIRSLREDYEKGYKMLSMMSEIHKFKCKSK